MLAKSILALRYTALTLVLLTSFFLLLVCQTESGTRWVIAKAVERLNAQPGISIVYEAVDNTLLFGPDFRNLEISSETENASMVISMERLDLSWSLALSLLEQRLVFHNINSMNLNIQSNTKTENPESLSAERILSSVFSLPIDFEIRQLSLPQLIFNDQQKMSISLRALVLDKEAFTIQSVHAAVDTLAINGNSFQLHHLGSVDGNLGWEYATASTNYEGTLVFSGNLDQFDIQHQLLIPIEMTSEGQVSGPFSVAPTLTLKHTGSIATESGYLPAVVQNINFSAETLSDSLHDALNLQATITSNAYGEFNLDTSARLTRSEITTEVSKLKITNGAGELSMTGRFGLQGTPFFNGIWQLNIDHPQTLPANIVLDQGAGNGTFSFTSDSDFNAVRMGHLEINTFAANVNELALQSSGQLDIADNKITLLDFLLIQQQNRITMKGDLSNNENINIELDLPSLATLLPDLTGTLSGSGVVTGTIQEPQLSLQLITSELGYQSLSLQSESIRGTINTSATRDINLVIEGKNISADWLPEAVQTFTLNGQGSLKQFEFDIATAATSVTASFAGEVVQDKNDWRITTSRADLESIYGNWQLNSSARLDISTSAVALDDHCWVFAPTKFCFSLLHHWDNSATSLNYQLNHFPLVYLTRDSVVTALGNNISAVDYPARPIGLTKLLDTYGVYVPASGFVTGEVGLQGKLTNSLTSGWEFSAVAIPESVVLGLIENIELKSSVSATDINTFALNVDHLQTNYSQGVLHSALAFTIAQSRQGQIKMGGNFDGTLDVDQARDLDGQFSFNFNEIAWLENIVPAIQNATGELKGNVDVSGSSTRPLLTSNINLTRGAVELPRYRLSLHDITASVESDSGNRFSFSADMSSGDGSLSLIGSLSTPFLDSRQIQLSARGKDFLALNEPDRKVVVSPDLEFQFTENALQINGDLAIPKMALQLESQVIRRNQVSRSNDARIVNTETDDQLRVPGQDNALQQIPITGKVNLALGDDVRFTGYGLGLKLSGNLQLEQTPLRPLLGYGEVKVDEGSYELYGQSLTLQDGQLLFIGNPTNPAVDLRAVRVVSDTTVGMHLSGTLNNVSGRLFSTPSLPESEILAMLVTGKSRYRQPWY